MRRNVITFGDLYTIFRVCNYGKKAKLTYRLWKNNFKAVFFHENMRQQDDAFIAHLLNGIRIGCHTEDDIKM